MRTYPPAATDKRIVLVGAGDSGGQALITVGRLFERLPAARKTYLWFNTHVQANDVGPALAPHGAVLPTPIPAWMREDLLPGHHDDHAEERPFVRDDRPHLALLDGAESRDEGAMACIVTSDDLYSALVHAVTRVGPRDGNQRADVDLVIAAFAGRGTGSGGLPVVIGMLEDLRAAFAGQVALKVTIAVQLPTVRVDGLALCRTRTTALIAEVTGIAEDRVATDPGRETGGWRNGAPWDDFLIFGMGGGRLVFPRGVVTDIPESQRYMAAVLGERLAGEAAATLAAEAPNRARLLSQRDEGTDLPRLFGATGIAELVFECDAAIDYAAARYEQLLYEAVRTFSEERR